MRDDEKKKLHENVKQEIRSLLISSPKTKYGGLTGSLLYFDYKQLNCGKEVPYVELGFHSFLALLRSMPDVVRIEYKENSPSYRVHPVYDQSTAHIQKMVLEQRDKYQLKNRLYSQNWYSNNSMPMNFGQLTFIQNYLPYYAYNSVDTHFHHQFNNSLRRSFPKVERRFEPYLLLTPPDYQKQDEKRPCLSSKLIDHNETCSSPNTFLETPSNFDLDDYRCLNESIEKDIPEENDTNHLITPVIPNFELLSSITNNSMILPTDNRSISPSKKSSSDNEQIVDSPESNENENLIKRINQAIRQCIDFRYIHRLCEIKFEYRHYPLSNEILSIKSHFENLAFNQYQQELEEFEKISRLNSTINDQKCQIMFDQYISLQRNYYYMNKIMNKNKR